MEISMSSVLTLDNLYAQIRSKKMPVKTGYKLSKLFKAIRDEADFYNEQIDALIAEYGERDENGEFVRTENGIRLRADALTAAQERINALTSLKVGLPDIQFSFDELEPLDLSLDDIQAFMPFIQE